MAYATIRSSSEGSIVATTTPNLTMPGTIEEGDLLVAVIAIDGNPTVTWDNTTFGTWTVRWDVAISTNVKGVCYVKVANADDDAGGTLDPTLSVSESGRYRIVCYQDWEGSLSGVTAGTTTTGTGTAPAPPSVTAPGGAGDNLFVAVSCSDNNIDVTGYPANYTTDQYHGDAVGSSAATIGMASRADLTTASDTPGTFTIASAEQWVCNTLVIEPAGGATISDVNYSGANRGVGRGIARGVG